MSPLKKLLDKKKFHSAECRTSYKTRTTSVRFCEGTHSIDVDMCTIYREIPVVKRELSFISQLKYAVGMRAEFRSCGDGNADFLKASYQNADRHGIQYPFCVAPFDINKFDAWT